MFFLAKLIGIIMLIPMALGGLISLFLGALSVVIVGGAAIFILIFIISIIAGIISAIFGN